MDSVSCRELINRLNWAISNDKVTFDSPSCSTVLHQALLKLRTSFSRNKEARNKLIELNIVPKLFCLLKKPQNIFSDSDESVIAKESDDHGQEKAQHQRQQLQREDDEEKKGGAGRNLLATTEIKDLSGCSTGIGGPYNKIKKSITVRRHEGYSRCVSSNWDLDIPSCTTSTTTTNTANLTSAASLIIAASSSSTHSSSSASSSRDNKKSASRWQDGNTTSNTNTGRSITNTTTSNNTTPNTSTNATNTTTSNNTTPNTSTNTTNTTTSNNTTPNTSTNTTNTTTSNNITTNTLNYTTTNTTTNTINYTINYTTNTTTTSNTTTNTTTTNYTTQRSSDAKPVNDITDLLLSVLGNFCVEQIVRKQVIKYQGIRVLQCILLESNKESIQRRCCRTLANLAVDCACRRIIHKTDITQRIVQLLEYTNNSECQLTYCHTLRLFSDSTQLNKTIINTNGIAVMSRLSKFAPHMVKCAAVKTMADLGRINCSVEFAQQVLTADGLTTLVEISNESGTLSQNALRVLIYLSRHNFIRPPLGSSGGIQTMKNKFDDEVSTVRKIEILNALCLFCNEAVNRVKLRQSDVLMVFIEALKDLIYSTLHNRIISALVNFLYDEVSFDMLLERGLVPVLFIHLQRCAGFSFNLPKTEPFVKCLIENIVCYPTKKRTKSPDRRERESKSSPSSRKSSKLNENSNSDSRMKESSVLRGDPLKEFKPNSKGLSSTERNINTKSHLNNSEKDSKTKCVSANLPSQLNYTKKTTENIDTVVSCLDSSKKVSNPSRKSSSIAVDLSTKFIETDSVTAKDEIHSTSNSKRPLSVLSSCHSSETTPESESSQVKFLKQDTSKTKDLSNKLASESLSLSLSGEDDDDNEEERSGGDGCDNDDDETKDKMDVDVGGGDGDMEENICQQEFSVGEDKKKQPDQTAQRYIFRIDSPTYQTDVKWSADNFTDGQTCKQDFGNETSNGSSALSPFSNSSYHSPDWSPDYNSQLRDDFSSAESDDEKPQDSLQEAAVVLTSKIASTAGDSNEGEQLNSVVSVSEETPKEWKKNKKKSSAQCLSKDSSISNTENEESAKENLYKKRERMMMSDSYVALRTTENNILVLLSRVSQKENPSKFLATVESFWCLLHYIGKVPFAYPRSIRILSRVVRNPFCFESLITFMAPAMIFLELMTSWDQRKDSQNKMFWTPSRGTMLNFNSAFAVDSYIKDLDDLFKAGQLILNDFSQVAEIHFGNSLLAQHLTKKTPQQDSVVACLPFLCRCRNVQEKLLVQFRGFDLLLNIIKNEPESYLSKVVILGLNYLSRHLNVTTTLQTIDRQLAYPKQALPGNNSSSDTQDCCLSNTKRNTAFVTDNGKKILVNQEAVTSRSEVFSAMFLSDFVEAETHEVKIGYTTPQALEVIVHYLHGCSLKCVTIQQLNWPKNKLTRNDLLNIMGLTDRYMLDKLRKYLACVIFQCYLDEKTVDTFYNAAVLHSYNDLSKDCIKYCLGQVCLGKRSIDCLLRFLNGPNHEVFLSSVKEMFIKHIVNENAMPK